MLEFRKFHTSSSKDPPGGPETRGNDPQSRRGPLEKNLGPLGILRILRFSLLQPLKDPIVLSYSWQRRNPSKSMLRSDQRFCVRPRDAGNIAKRPPAMFPTVLDQLRAPYGSLRQPTGPYAGLRPPCGARTLDFSPISLLSASFARAEGLQPMTPL